MFKAIEMLDTGITYINSSTIGAEIQLPFGGTKGTGNDHREAGTAAIETFTEWKSVDVDYSGTLQKAQIDDLIFYFRLSGLPEEGSMMIRVRILFPPIHKE